MVVFGVSTSDAGRRFKAPASFDFDDIGPYPWTKLFEAPDSDVSTRSRSVSCRQRRTSSLDYMYSARRPFCLVSCTAVVCVSIAAVSFVWRHWLHYVRSIAYEIIGTVQQQYVCWYARTLGCVQTFFLCSGCLLYFIYNVLLREDIAAEYCT